MPEPLLRPASGTPGGYAGSSAARGRRNSPCPRCRATVLGLEEADADVAATRSSSRAACPLSAGASSGTSAGISPSEASYRSAWRPGSGRFPACPGCVPVGARACSLNLLSRPSVSGLQVRESPLVPGRELPRGTTSSSGGMSTRWSGAPPWRTHIGVHGTT